jgi:hypothetical protein
VILFIGLSAGLQEAGEGKRMLLKRGKYWNIAPIYEDTITQAVG